MNEIEHAIEKHERKKQLEKIKRQIRALKIVLAMSVLTIIFSAAMALYSAKHQPDRHYNREEVSQIPTIILEQKARQI